MAAGVGAVLALTVSTAALSASASTGTAPGTGTAAVVQSVLDRVLGPGSAIVQVSDTVRTSTGLTTTQQVGSAVPSSIATLGTTTASGSSQAVVQQNAISGTTTTVATPAGALVRRSVSVAVDRTRLGGRSLAAIRALVTGAAGVVASRGDRVSVVVTRFAAPVAPAVAPSPTPLSLLLPFVPQLLWVLGGVAALAVLAAAVRGSRRPA